MKKNIFYLFIMAFLVIWLPVFAQTPPQPGIGTTPPTGPAATNYGLDPTAQEAGLVNTPATAPTVSQIIGMIINAVLGIIAVIYLVLIINAGIHWMTAGGNEETITKAKRQLINSTIGLIIIFTAFIITNYVVFTTLGFVIP